MYGTPIKRNGIAVIAVVRTRYSFGGGEGGTQAGETAGSGPGAGASLTPVGYLELREGRSRFRPIR